jgi:hypothetical protein
MTLASDVPRLTTAAKLAKRMFAKIGVDTEWPQRRDACSKGGGIVITLSYLTPANQLPGARVLLGALADGSELWGLRDQD